MWAAAAALGTVAALGPGSYPSRGGAEALFLDAGQGDATLLRIGERFLLVDAGPRWGSLDAGRLVVLPALRAEGVRSLEVLALTHSDKDHIGGAWSVVDRARIGELWIPPSMLEDPSVRDLRRRAAARRIPLRLAAAGHEASIGDWRVRVLWPPEGLRPPGRNEGGLVLRVEGPEGCLLLPGDVPGGVEEALVHELSRCALLKLGHHGSRTSTSPAWLRALDPEVGIASASASFADRFPAADVRARLRDASVTLYETYRWGAIRVRLERPFPVVVPFLLEPLGSPAAAG
jgi:competence protein ComEC